MGSHLKREGVLATMFCSHWFITLFAYTLPFDHLLRVWDVLFLEGPKIIFRCARAEHHPSVYAQRNISRQPESPLCFRLSPCRQP